jgi:hypothetical protein
LKTLNIPLSRLPALFVKLRDYLNVEGRIVFSLDHLRYAAARKPILIDAMEGEVLAQTSWNTLWTYQNTLVSIHGPLVMADANYQNGFIIQLISRVLQLLCTTLSSLKVTDCIAQLGHLPFAIRKPRATLISSSRQELAL